MNSQSLNRTPVVPARVPNTFWGPDLVSTRDLGLRESRRCFILPEL